MDESIFVRLLDRIEVRIHGATTFYRHLTDEPSTEGLKFYPQTVIPWDCAKIECSDSDIEGYVGSKSEIIFPMFYSKTNIHDDQNYLGKGPIMVIDCCMSGAYPKEILLDGQVFAEYRPGGKAFFWIHIALEPNIVWVG